MHEHKNSIYEKALDIIQKEKAILSYPTLEYDIKLNINLPNKGITLIAASSNPDDVKMVVEAKQSMENPLTPKELSEADKKRMKFIEDFSKKEKVKVTNLYGEARQLFKYIKEIQKTYVNLEWNSYTRYFDHLHGERGEFYHLGWGSREELKGVYKVLDTCIVTEDNKVKYLYNDWVSNNGRHFNMLAIPNKNSTWDTYYFERKTGELVKHRLISGSGYGFVDFDKEDIFLPKAVYDCKTSHVPLIKEDDSRGSEPMMVIDKNYVDLIYGIVINKKLAISND